MKKIVIATTLSLLSFTTFALDDSPFSRPYPGAVAHALCMVANKEKGDATEVAKGCAKQIKCEYCKKAGIINFCPSYCG